jgi:hypothetical protein
MREALGQPLQNISRELLNKVVSKEVARDLRKYKFSLGKTPNKENKRPLSNERGRSMSPTTKRLNFNSPANGDEVKSPARMVMTREMKDIVKELEGGVHDKLSMLKMVAVKCAEADSSYKKIRQLLAKGDVTQAEK